VHNFVGLVVVSVRNQELWERRNRLGWTTCIGSTGERYSLRRGMS
jgi:hypothetical protein